MFVLQPAELVDDVRGGVTSVHAVPAGLELCVVWWVLHCLLPGKVRSLGFSDICKMLRDKWLSICRCFLFHFRGGTKRWWFVCSCVAVGFMYLLRKSYEKFVTRFINVLL